MRSTMVIPGGAIKAPWPGLRTQRRQQPHQSIHRRLTPGIVAFREDQEEGGKQRPESSRTQLPKGSGGGTQTAPPSSAPGAGLWPRGTVCAMVLGGAASDYR